MDSVAIDPGLRPGMGREVYPSPRQGACGCEKVAVQQMPNARRPPVQRHGRLDALTHGAMCPGEPENLNLQP